MIARYNLNRLRNFFAIINRKKFLKRSCTAVFFLQIFHCIFGHGVACGACLAQLPIRKTDESSAQQQSRSLELIAFENRTSWSVVAFTQDFRIGEWRG